MEYANKKLGPARVTRQKIEATSSACLRTFFPPFCQHCGQEGAWLCVPCKEIMPALPHALCPHCGTRFSRGELLPLCARETGLARFLCAYEFKNPVVRSIIHAYKFRHGKTLHFLISSLLIDWLRAQAAFADVAPTEFIVTSVPLSPRRERERGFNQSELIARDIARAFGLTYATALVRVKNTKPQTEMANNAERAANIRGVFASSPTTDIRKMRVVLVDDVYTTGSTLKECAAVLKSVGAKEIIGVTFAK